MSENEYDSKSNFKKKKDKNVFIILLILTLIILYVLLKDTLLQLLGVVLAFVCVGIILLKTGKYIIKITYFLVNGSFKLIAIILAIGCIFWVLSLL
jgi:hypothetical protein